MKLLISLTLLTQLLIAAPAFQGKRTFTQPDGTVVIYHNRGDEYLHYSETEDGEILLFNKEHNRMEHVKVLDNRLRPSGEAYTDKPTTKSSTRTQKTERIDKATLRELHDLRKSQRNMHKHKKSMHQHHKKENPSKTGKE